MKRVSIDSNQTMKKESPKSETLSTSHYQKRHEEAIFYWTEVEPFNSPTEVYGRHRIVYNPSTQLYIHSNGWTIGYAITIEDARRAIDILEGRV